MAQSIGATPVAVLLGAALIAAAVYFGLRARPVVVAPALPTTAATAGSDDGTAASAAPAPPGTSTPPSAGISAPPTGAGARLHAPTAPEVDADVLAALEKQRPTLVDICWKPLTKGKTNPPPASYVFDLSFDATGKEVARGLSMKQGATDELSRCLNVQAPSLTIPARGTRVRARVPFTLP